MKTPPTHWKVKASPIVREFMNEHNGCDLSEYDLFAKDAFFDSYGYNAGKEANGHFSGLPTLTQAQFKKHFYDPWKAGQAFDAMTGNPMEQIDSIIASTGLSAGKITKVQFKSAPLSGQQLVVESKPKPTRQRVEMKYHLEVKKALQGEVESLQQDLATAQSRLESLKQYNDQLAKINQSLADKLTTAESTIEKLHRSHLSELNELTKDRDLAVYIAWGMGICAAVLAVAKLIGG